MNIPSIGLDAAGGAAPQDGDIVVTYEAQGALRYSVSRVPGAAQFRVAARDEAVRFAREFGRRHGVDIWSCEVETRRLIEAHRRVASVA